MAAVGPHFTLVETRDATDIAQSGPVIYQIYLSSIDFVLSGDLVKALV